jgi:hypothetical protein
LLPHSFAGKNSLLPIMKTVQLTLFLACMVFSAARCVNAAQHVILITIDGGAAYHLDNPNLSLPNIRKMITEGAWADKGSETVFPSVTHPSHTSIITGVRPIKHGDLENALYEREYDRTDPPNSLLHSQVVKVKSLFDEAKEKNLTTASIFWPETGMDPSIDYNLMLRTTGKKETVIENSWTKELRANGVPIDFYYQILDHKASTELFDPLNTLALCDVIEKHKPNLMAIHLVSTDGREHTYGPTSQLAVAAFEEADALIGRIVEATKKAGIYDETAFIVTADHGFATVRYEMNIRPYFAHAGLEGKIKIFPDGWTPFLRLLPTFNQNTDGPKLRKALDALEKNVHVLRVYRSEEYPSLGLPRYEDSDRIPGQYMIVSDIGTYLLDREGDSTDLTPREHPAYSHGYLPQYPEMYPLLVLFGSGIQRGVRLGHVHQIDIAPTVTELLGLNPLNFDGTVLRSALAR